MESTGTFPHTMLQERIAEDYSAHGNQQPPTAHAGEHAVAPGDKTVQSAEHLSQQHDSNRARQLILVVDDEESIADLLAEFLTSEGYRAVVAHNGREALVCALRERPALILCDWMMPGLSGTAFLAELRRRPAIARIPIVVMSSMRPDQRSFPGIPFLAKPFELDAVLDLVVRATRPSSLSNRLHGAG